MIISLISFIYTKCTFDISEKIGAKTVKTIILNCTKFTKVRLYEDYKQYPNQIKPFRDLQFKRWGLGQSRSFSPVRASGRFRLEEGGGVAEPNMKRTCNSTSSL